MRGWRPGDRRARPPPLRAENRRTVFDDHLSTACPASKLYTLPSAARLPPRPARCARSFRESIRILLGYPSPRGRRGGKATADASVAVAPPSEPAADTNTILQVKVWWAGISPVVWRRVLVPTTFTLREFHSVIQVAMGWEGIHLYAFQLRAARYGSKFASGTATR